MNIIKQKLTDTRDDLIQKQKELCEKLKYPMFVPENGICWHCNEDMVSIKWAVEHQTGCKNCLRSYCD